MRPVRFWILQWVCEAAGRVGRPGTQGAEGVRTMLHRTQEPGKSGQAGEIAKCTGTCWPWGGKSCFSRLSFFVLRQSVKSRIFFLVIQYSIFTFWGNINYRLSCILILRLCLFFFL